jgi:hypothetical protein
MLKNIAIFWCGFLIGAGGSAHANPFSPRMPQTSAPSPQITVSPRPFFPTFNGSVVRRPMNCDATPMLPYCDCAAPGDQCVPR